MLPNIFKRGIFVIISNPSFSCTLHILINNFTSPRPWFYFWSVISYVNLTAIDSLLVPFTATVTFSLSLVFLHANLFIVTRIIFLMHHFDHFPPLFKKHKCFGIICRMESRFSSGTWNFFLLGHAQYSYANVIPYFCLCYSCTIKCCLPNPISVWQSPTHPSRTSCKVTSIMNPFLSILHLNKCSLVLALKAIFIALILCYFVLSSYLFSFNIKDS